MQKYTSPSLEISMELPNHWHGIENKEFFTEELKIAPEQAESTAILLVLVENDKVSRYISVTHDMEIYGDEKSYLDGLNANRETLIGAGCKIMGEQTVKSKHGFRVDHMMVQANNVLMSQYYVHINELLLCFATQVTGKGDQDDNVMANIVFSINMGK